VPEQLLPSYVIKDWCFSPSQATLVKADEMVNLTPLQNGIMVALIECHPQLVSANSLLQTLDQYAQGNRNKLYQSIAKLRRVFSDSTHKAQYIETVSRKGYRLVPEPALVEVVEPADVTEQQSPQEIAPQILAENEIHSGVLEQNIFDDLGFMDKAPQIVEVKSPIQGETQPDLAMAEPSVDQVLASQHPSPSTPSTKKALVVWPIRRRLMILLLLLCMSIAGYYVVESQPQSVVAQAPDAVFIEPLTTNDKAQQQLPASAQSNISWWITQKVQHLPLIKVRVSDNKGQFPRISTRLTVNQQQQTRLTLTYQESSEQLQPQRIDLVIAAEVDELTAQHYQLFNQQLVALIMHSEAVVVSHDVCLLDDFLAPQDSQHQQCLVVLNQQAKTLLANAQQALAEPQSSDNIAQQISELSQQTIEKFPQHSLGYFIAAQLSRLLGQESSAFSHIIAALERNNNQQQMLRFLGQLYRQTKQFGQSLHISELLASLAPSNKHYVYLISRDLVALGYRQRASELLSAHQIALTSPSDITYFMPLNYNTIKRWAAQKDTLNEQQRQMLRVKLSDSSFFSNANDKQQMLTDFANTPSEKIDYNWRVGAMYLLNEQPKLAKKAFERDPEIGHFIETFSLVTDDRIYLLPSYVNLLMQQGQQQRASKIIKRFILLAQVKVADNRWTLSLAEAYALTGDIDNALTQLAKLLATGWLPHPDRQVWTLSNNPNFASLSQQWEFINLLELIENRRKLMLMLLADNKGSIE